MKQFEIPYNFDFELINNLDFFVHNSILDPDFCHCIYFPPYWEDYKCAKYYYPPIAGKETSKVNNLTRDMYIKHIKYIDSRFEGKSMLLLQQNDYMIDLDLLKNFYIDKLHIKKFCVGSLEQAKVLKDIDNSFEVIGSITMRVTPEMLSDYDTYKYFDGFVLWFPYNRDIDLVKSLPKTFKYILLINCNCSLYCPGVHHWLVQTREAECNVRCPRNLDLYSEERDSKYTKYNVYIEPWDTVFWDNYVSYYKLQGREYTTKFLIADILKYTLDWNKIKTSILTGDENKFKTFHDLDASEIFSDFCYGKASLIETNNKINNIIEK